MVDYRSDSRGHEKPPTGVRALVRRISLTFLGSRDKPESRDMPPSRPSRQPRPSSVPVERSKSRLDKLRRRVMDMPIAIPEEGDDDFAPSQEPIPRRVYGENIFRAATPVGLKPKMVPAESVGLTRAQTENMVEGIPWKMPRATLIGQRAKYDVSPLVFGGKIEELWFRTGDTLVYLCGKEEAWKYKPSLRLSRSLLSHKSEFFSTALSDRWQEHGADHRKMLEKEQARYILFFPPWEDDTGLLDSRKVDSESDFHQLLDQLVATRNFFAFMFGQPWVLLEDPLGPTMLSDFMDRMEMYVLGLNSETKGRPSRERTLRDVELWVRNKDIDDARKSPRRIIDILVISERYRWAEIFTEAFVHGAGRYDLLLTFPNFNQIAAPTRQLLERASFSIKSRVSTVEYRLSAFTFPFTSFRTRNRQKSRQKSHQKSRQRPNGRYSTRNDDATRAEPLDIPGGWYRAYLSFRKWVKKYYTTFFNVKSWPPARFTRGMILMLQTDFLALYELLVDHDGSSLPEGNPFRSMMSRVLSDFEKNSDAAAPSADFARFPVLPQLPPEDSPAWNKKQNREAISVVLLDSYNLIDVPSSSGDGAGGGGGNRFVEAFKEFERDYGTGRTVTKSVEAREGRWFLVYAVLSTLSKVGKEQEWEGLKYTWGVEYWLCTELLRIPPWRHTGAGCNGSRRKRANSIPIEDMNILEIEAPRSGGGSVSGGVVISRGGGGGGSSGRAGGLRRNRTVD